MEQVRVLISKWNTRLYQGGKCPTSFALRREQGMDRHTLLERATPRMEMTP